MSPPFPASHPTRGGPCPGWPPRPGLAPARGLDGHLRPGDGPSHHAEGDVREQCAVSAGVSTCVDSAGVCRRRECARRAHPCVTCRGHAGQASAWCWVGLCKVAWVPTDDLEAGPPPAAPALRSGAGPSAPPGASSVALAFLSLAVALPGSGGRSHSRLKGKEVAIGGQGHRPRAAKTRLGSPSRTTCGGPELQF